MGCSRTQRLRHRSSAPRSDSWHRHPLVLARLHDRPNGAESVEKCPGAVDRDAIYGRQNRFAGADVYVTPTLSVGRPVPWSMGLSPACEIEEPIRRIGRAVAPDDYDPLIGDREYQPAHRSWAECLHPRVPLDQQNRETASLPQRVNLAPESSFAERHRQIDRRLTLDERRAAEVVVRGGQRLESDVDAEALQKSGNAAPPFVDIGDNRDPRHQRSIAWRPASSKVSNLAFSRREKA